MFVVDNRKSQDECGNASKSKENIAFFLWQGRHSSVSGRDTAAFLSIWMENHEDSQVWPLYSVLHFNNSV